MSLPEAKNGAYNEFFASSPLDCIPKPAMGKVISVKSTDTVRQATRELGEHAVPEARWQCSLWGGGLAMA